MTRYDSIVRGGEVVTAVGVFRAEVAIADGQIVEVAPEIAGHAGEEIDARGLHLFPGVVDLHVHFNEPGRAEWEGWASGSLASAVGGTTTVAEMPLNAHPPTLDGPAFDAKAQAAAASACVDFALWGGLTPRNLDRLEELAARGVVGFKAFMCHSGMDDFPAADDGTLYAGMQIAAAHGLPVAVHAENDAITAHLSALARQCGRVGARDYAASRPPIAEIEAIARALVLAEATGCALHVVHVSTARGAALIAAARARGIDVSGETCPHYLWFSEDDLAELGAVAKCAPPLRSSDEVNCLWAALARGELQIVASDHSPSPPAMKRGRDFFAIWGGIAGCQTLLPALLTLGKERDLPLPTVANLTSDAPARRLHLAHKGRIAPGHDADLTLVELDARYTLDAAALHYRHQLSPFVQQTFRGRVMRTMLRGQTIVRDGQRVGRARGQLLRPGAGCAA